MRRAWRLFILGHLWCLPLSVGYLLFVVLPFYRPSAWRWNQGVLTCVCGTFLDKEGKKQTRIWGRPGGQTVGSVQCYASEAQRQRADLRVHETAHVVQFFVGGLVGFVLAPIGFYLIDWSWVSGLLWGGFLGSLGAGLLYLVLFGWHFARLWKQLGFREAKKNWRVAYRKNPFEVQAYAVQAHTTDTNWGA